MPRTKRKREAVVDPSPTARRRRSTAGHEPTKNEAEPIQNSNKSAPKTRAAAATAATPVPTVVSSNVKDAATTIMQSSSDNGKPSELSNKALQGKAIANAGAPSTEIGDEGNDHAETEEMKTSQTDKIEISQMGDETSDLRSSLPAQNSKNKNSKQTRRSSWMTDPTALDAAAAAVAVASNDFAENSRSREATIRRLLSHRKILLKGVRYGGNAARQRIEIIESKNPLQKTMTDEEETAAFQDMTRNVTSLVRKQGRQDNAMNAAADLTERRTSVSLRRGSSVGKRMNAALTSLTHHQGGLVLHGSENQTHPTNYVGVPAVQLLKSAQADTLMIVSGAQTRLDAGAVGTGLVGEAIGMVHPQAAQHFQTQHAAGPTVALNTMTTSSTAGAQKGARSASAAGLGAGPRKIQGAVTLGRGIVQKNVSMVAGQQQQQQVKAVSMMGGVTKIVLPQRPAHHQMEQPHFQPVMHVVCPETTALRERRDEIRIKLAKMLQDRHHRSELATCAIVENIPSKPHERRSSFSFIQSSLATRPSVSGQRTIPQSPRQLKQKRPRCILHLPLWQGPDPPPQLPRRRKTHWDTVLEEMRWMATDFIEERKWKHSTARMLGIQAVKAALNEQTVTFPALDNGTKPVFDMKSESETSVIFEIDSTKREPGGNRTGVEDDSLVTKDTDTDTDTRILECFHSVTVEDVVASRAAAKKASSMVAELVRANANTTARSFSQSNFEISDGRGRVTAYEEGRVSNVTDAQSPDSVSDSTPHFTMIADATTRAKGNALEVASNHVDLVLKTINDEKKSTAVDFQSSPETHGFHLSSRQSEVVKIIEDRWQRIQAGAVIRGPVASGKTIAACSLLWRNRSLGPQLLICSSASLIRWLHELRRLPDFHVRTLSSIPATEATHHGNFEEREVVVCRLSSISEMDVTLLVKFRSIVIDCRHPSGYVGSTSPVTDTSRGSEQDRAAPDELSSCAGWNKIAVATSHGDINRLLIDKPDVGDSAPYLRGLSNRRFLEVLALRTGILFGTKTFLSPVYSIGKAILKWSRHRIKGFSGGSGSKFQQVTMLLTTLIKTFDCCIESEKRLNDGMTPGSGLFPWEIRYSKMFPGQCAAYNRVCRQSCSSLSRSHGLQEDAPFAEAAAALLRVRRNCTHSDMGGVLRTVKRRAPTISGVAVPPKSLYTSSSKLADGFNPSQPNFEIARRILTESSKLRHLASILVHECGCDFVWDDSIKSLLSELAIPAISRSKFRETKDSRIAILAVLPEIQILVSVLLNSIGIDHEVLLRPACSYADLSSSESNVEAIAWAHCQLVLSKFNSSSSNKRPNVSIVVASPISVAGDHGGLGVEQADTVICLDEDWSGRGELVMLALVSRCRFHKELNGNGTFRVFRLVAENTCEEAFLASRSEVSIGEASVSGEGGTWPVNAFGAFVAPGPWTTNGTEKRMKEFWRRSRVPRGGSFLFPGSNLFCKREEDIAKILCSKIPLKQLMPSSDKFFFPLLEGEDVIETEMIMLRHLMKGEESASTYRCQESLLLASPVLFVPILPPLLIEFPRAIVERFNLPFYLSRRFVTTVSEIATIQEFRDDTGSILSRTSDPGVNLGRLPMNVTADLVDRELCPFSTKSPTELAASALFYTQAINEKESSNVRNASMSTITVRRVNLYASMFSNSSQLGSLPHDGNQGSEALVYFPPIFPRLQECSSLAKHDVESLESRLHLGDRHAGDSRAEANRNDESTVALVGHNPLGLNVLRFITDDESSYSDAASVLMDLSDDYGVAGIGAVPLERDSALASANCFHEPGNAANVASNAQNEWIASTPLCDMEEFQAALQLDQAGTNANSMIVIVSRKRARGSTGQPRPSQFSRGFGIEAWKGVSAVSASAHSDLNGSGRKGKRPLSASAFNRIPSIDTAQPPPPVGQHFPQRSKDDYRHRLLSTLRQSGIGATIFEAPIFRVASVRVRNKVSDRIIRHSWTSGVALDTGPGLPLLVCKQQASSTAGSCGMFEVNPNTWTSIVKRLKSKEATTGMEAIDFSFAQRSALQDSLVSPCRVDFGPFLCGFLSSPSGMTAVALPKPRVGVTLPMGVKITQAAKDQDSVTWNGDDDNKLKSTVVRFGMNWVLAAKILSGFQDVAIRNSLLPRSARSCRDRWQRLTRSDPSLVIKERTSELVLLDTDQVPPEGDLGRRWEMTHGIESQSVAATRRTIEFLCPSSVYRDYVNLNENHGANADNAVSSVRTTFKSDADRQSAQQQQKASRTFSAFKKANATKQIVPISIPGGSSSSMGPSHPSYDEAVQTSISAAWINGRTDMWPLQLLDAADKQRAAVSDAAAISVPATGRQGLSSSSKAHNNGTSSSSRSQPGHASQKSQRSTSTSVAAPPLSHKPQIANPFVPSGTSGGVSHTLGSSPNQSSSASSTKQSFAPPQAPHATAASSATKAAVTATKAAPPSLQGHGSILNDREHSGQLQAKP